MDNLVTVQWLDHPVGIVRIHDSPEDVGESWSWSCVIEKIDETTVMIHAAKDAPKYRSKIVKKVRSLGFKKMAWKRGKIWKEFNI